MSGAISSPAVNAMNTPAIYTIPGTSYTSPNGTEGLAPYKITFDGNIIQIGSLLIVPFGHKYCTTAPTGYKMKGNIQEVGGLSLDFFKKYSASLARGKELQEIIQTAKAMGDIYRAEAAAADLISKQADARIKQADARIQLADSRIKEASSKVSSAYQDKEENTQLKKLGEKLAINAKAELDELAIRAKERENKKAELLRKIAEKKANGQVKSAPAKSASPGAIIGQNKSAAK